ncbi:MAG: hypothetical protein ABI378_09140 [Chitinophagaceae bacterium]
MGGLRFGGFDANYTADKYDYSPTELGTILATDILTWRSQSPMLAKSELENFLWPRDSLGYSTDTNGIAYNSALLGLLTDSAYLSASMMAANSNTSSGSLNARIANTLATAKLVHSPIDELIANFYDNYYTTYTSKVAIDNFLQGNPATALLGALYADNPSMFLGHLLTESESYPSAGGSTARAVLGNALQQAAGGGSAGIGGSLVATYGGMAANNSNFASAASIAIAAALDYDQFYLAEHVLYGSSRLGIKKYWPYQYRYGWDKSKSIADNQAALDSNDVSYRKPWYYQPWQSLVLANETDALGHANIQPAYSSRIIGQKLYELTSNYSPPLTISPFEG